MSRPRKGSPEAELATQRWRETMNERYGSVKEKMRDIGAIGGRKGTTGGFAAQEVGKDGMTGSQRASVVGSIGGKISRRKPKQ